MTSTQRSTAIDGNNHHRTSRYTPIVVQDEFHRNNYVNTMTRSMEQQHNYRTTKSKRSVEWDEDNLHQNEGKFSNDSISTSLECNYGK
jgi:hypothetical protein